MSAAPPIKPPRGIKPSKETSGLLITVIRALSASETNEQREVEKEKLEKDYKLSDQRLDELVSLHDQDLTEVMRIFGILSERVTTAREKIHAVKENLNACKQLLRCRREELMKLWLEGIEHKHVLQLLNDIDQLREIPARLNSYLEKKLYLHATQLLVSALAMGEGILEGVEGLKEVRVELEEKKKKLISKLLEELTKHLYREQAEEVALKRQGSNRDFQRGIEGRSSKGHKVKRSLLDVPVPAFMSGQVSRKASTVGLEDPNALIEDEDNLNPEDNSEHYLAILIECLALLKQIPQAIEVLKTQMQNELLKIADITSKAIVEDAEKRGLINIKLNAAGAEDNSLPDCERLLLMELLITIFERFRQVIAAHSSALFAFSKCTKKYNLDVPLYEIVDVWGNIQAVLQILLTEYLDVQNIVEGPFQAPVSLNEQTVNINTYFARKKPPRRTGLLFKFDSTTHPISLNSYVKDHRYSSLALTDNRQMKIGKKLVCKPNPKNITLVFRPITQFIEDIEGAIGVPEGNAKCTLSSFLADYVKEVYLGRHHVLVATTIDAATKNPEAWRLVTPPELIRDLGLSRPLLQSTVKVEQIVAELRLLMIALPLQGEHFCTLALNVLHNYRETCQTEYRSIVNPDRDDRRIRSAMWLKDEEIISFIKSLPNWECLKSEIQYRRGPSGRRIVRRQETQDEESPEDVRQRYNREAEILASNLGEGGINANEIISDIGQIRCLALLHESIEWFTVAIRAFIAELQQATVKEDLDGNSIPPMRASLVDSLKQVADEFDHLANTCLLVLHLEVRVQCFYYLHPRGDIKSLSGVMKDPGDADPRVEDLSRFLQHIDEAVQAMLHPRKAKYIFDGLGHLIAKILITSAQYIVTIDEGGIHTMCSNVFTLQQTLTNITLTREVALDHARQYYELFYGTPEGILNGVLEHGQQFSELEYINALQLLARSRQEHAAVHRHMERLSEILGDIGVTV